MKTRRTPEAAAAAALAGLRQTPRAIRPVDKAQRRREVAAALTRLIVAAFPNMDHHWRRAAARQIRKTIAAHGVAWAEHHAAETASRRAAERRRAERRRPPGE